MASIQMEKAADSFERMRAQSAQSGEPSLAEQRAAYEAVPQRFPTPDDIRVETISMNGVPAERLTGSWVTRQGAILYLHGGGYTVCSPRTHRELAGRIGRAAGIAVYVPDYRLAPEHPFPAALEDARTCYGFIMQQGVAADALAVAGDSAGGGLTAALLLSLRDDRQPLPACACLLSPWTDLAVTGQSIETKVEDDPIITPAGIRQFAAYYAGSHDVRDPAISPLYGDFTGLPPLLIQVGSREMLLEDSIRLAERAKAAGVKVTLEIENGAIHVWQSLPHVPEAISATDRISKFISQQCQAPGA